MQVLRPENEARYAGMSMGDYLEENKYSRAFRAHYLLPMCAAVWSVPNSQARDNLNLGLPHRSDQF